MLNFHHIRDPVKQEEKIGSSIDQAHVTFMTKLGLAPVTVAPKVTPTPNDTEIVKPTVAPASAIPPKMNKVKPKPDLEKVEVKIKLLNLQKYKESLNEDRRRGTVTTAAAAAADVHSVDRAGKVSTSTSLISNESKKSKVVGKVDRRQKSNANDGEGRSRKVSNSSRAERADKDKNEIGTAAAGGLEEDSSASSSQILSFEEYFELHAGLNLASKTVKEIIGATEIPSGGKVFLVNFNEMQEPLFVKSDDMRLYFPIQLIHYYEARISWVYEEGRQVYWAFGQF